MLADIWQSGIYKTRNTKYIFFFLFDVSALYAVQVKQPVMKKSGYDYLLQVTAMSGVII